MSDKAPPFVCRYCGLPTWTDPAEQSPPADYCHEADHHGFDHLPSASQRPIVSGLDRTTSGAIGQP